MEKKLFNSNNKHGVKIDRKIVEKIIENKMSEKIKSLNKLNDINQHIRILVKQEYCNPIFYYQLFAFLEERNDKKHLE